jgi:uncharacterized protein YjiS (DUF1127 family)
LTFEQKAAAKYQKIKDGKKKAIEKKEKNDDARLRKSPTSNIPPGLISAIHEWARALLGLPRQSGLPTSSQVDIHTVTQHHLPAEAKITEVEAWSNHSKNRSEYLESTINQKMAARLATNPKASTAAKAELKKQITKEVVADYNRRTPQTKFISRVAQTTASVQSYDRSRLALAEGSLAACGFPRLTLQWTSALATAWNSAVIDALVASWLECYNARGVPACYDIPTSEETPRLAKEILTQWMSNKRRQFRQELKDKELISTPEGQQMYLKKKLTAKDKKAMQAMRKKVNIFFTFPYKPK